MLADKIIAQRNAGLISKGAARRALRRAAKQCRFNADYADNPAQYSRWSREATRAASAVQS